MNPTINGHRIPSSLILAGSQTICGSEAVVFIHGDSVTRIAVGEVNRPNIPIVVQPLSTSRAGAFTVEVLPYYKPASEFPPLFRAKFRQFILDNIPRGYYDADLHHGNYGLGPGGWRVIDPDAIRKQK